MGQFPDFTVKQSWQKRVSFLETKTENFTFAALITEHARIWKDTNDAIVEIPLHATTSVKESIYIETQTTIKRWYSEH
jgi:hypothetical protein